jgi:hypothetical protein
MKFSSQIIKWGNIKPFFDKTYRFNTIDIETVNNQLFLFGFTLNNQYHYVEDDFYTELHDMMISSLQDQKDVLTWSRYDNTHLLKLILSKASKKDIKQILLKVGKITPIYEYQYNEFHITIVNIIKDSIIFKFTDLNDKSKTLIIYNLKNLYDTDLLTTAKNYGFDYYSKMGDEFHLIDPKRYQSDMTYQKNVLKSNELDNIVLIDIANRMLSDFKTISGYLPKSIFTNGSLARSYLLSQIGTFGSKDLNFNMKFKGYHKKGLLDYAMRSYHGGKIESYVLGYLPKAKVIDITSAYPYAMSLLPKLTGKMIHSNDINILSVYYYAFINCEIEIKDMELIHPVIVENPINKSNISPYGHIKTIITKLSYDYLLKKGCKVKVIDFYACEHENSYPYKKIIDTLFSERLKYKKSNPSLSQMYKIILNSLYGITYELTDIYTNIDDKIEWAGYRAGDYFNPIIASYITDFTRTYLSEVSHHIIMNGGEVYLNMTDSIIYQGDIYLDIFSDLKVLGKFEQPTEIKEVYILGAGRYEYKNAFDNTFTIKNRGFSVSVKDKSFYSQLVLNDNVSLVHKTFVTSFKATTNKYAYEQMGYLIDDTYNINPFNLGGKRLIQNMKCNLNKEYTKTFPIYLEKDIIK